jgi:hypothetical protein
MVRGASRKPVVASVMQLAEGQKKRLATAISEALAYRVETMELRNRGLRADARTAFGSWIEELRLKKSSAFGLWSVDATHRAIVDRCVSAIEEGLL